MISNSRTAVGLLSLCLCGCEAKLDPPQDREVRDLFIAHRADFEKVREMADADPIPAVQLSPDGPKAHSRRGGWVGLSNPRQADLARLGLSRPRIEEYLRCMRSRQAPTAWNELRRSGQDPRATFQSLTLRK